MVKIIQRIPQTASFIITTQLHFYQFLHSDLKMNYITHIMKQSNNFLHSDLVIIKPPQNRFKMLSHTSRLEKHL